MKTFRTILTLSLFLASFPLIAQEAVRKPDVVKFNAVYTVPLSKALYTAPKPQMTVIREISFAKNSASAFGTRMEPVLQMMMKKSQGRKNTWIDATYNNGYNGIDGLLVKRKHGVITSVNVYEFKTNGAKLNVNEASAPQMSKKWILTSIDKKMASLEKRLKTINNDIIKAKSKGKLNQVKSLKNDFQKINAEKRNIRATRKFIQDGNYQRYIARLTYKNGRIDVTIQKILGEKNWRKIPRWERTQENTFYLGKEKSMKGFLFSLFDKDDKKLTINQRFYKRQFFKQVKIQLKSEKRTQPEIAQYINDMKSGKITDIQGKSKIEMVSRKDNKRANFQMQTLKYGFVALAVLQEAVAGKKLIYGEITTSDFVFETVLNVVSISGVFINSMASFLTPLFIAVDAAKNIYDFTDGKIILQDAVINIASNVVSLLVATKVSFAVGTFSSILPPLGGLVVGFVTFAVTYFVVYTGSRFLGKFIVNKYDSLREPEYFKAYCNAVRIKYAIA